MDMTPEQTYRLEELRRQFSSKGTRILHDNLDLVHVNDILSFYVDHGWQGGYHKRGQVIKITPNSIIATIHGAQPNEPQTSRIDKERDRLRRRDVRRMGTLAEWEERKALSELQVRESVARREHEAREKFREQWEEKIKGDAMVVLAEAHPDELEDAKTLVRDRYTDCPECDYPGLSKAPGSICLNYWCRYERPGADHGK